MNGVPVASSVDGIVSQLTVEPERYLRINIAKNSKGYTSDVTISVTGVMTENELFDDAMSMLRRSDFEIREEIKRREARDDKIENPDYPERPLDDVPF